MRQVSQVKVMVFVFIISTSSRTLVVVLLFSGVPVLQWSVIMCLYQVVDFLGLRFVCRNYVCIVYDCGVSARNSTPSPFQYYSLICQLSLEYHYYEFDSGYNRVSCTVTAVKSTSSYTWCWIWPTLHFIARCQLVGTVATIPTCFSWGLPPNSNP